MSVNTNKLGGTNLTQNWMKSQDVRLSKNQEGYWDNSMQPLMHDPSEISDSQQDEDLSQHESDEHQAHDGRSINETCLD